jgi:hypothetical protein
VKSRFVDKYVKSLVTCAAFDGTIRRTTNQNKITDILGRMTAMEIIKRFGRKKVGNDSDLSLARVVMTSSQICAEVEAQVKRLAAIRRSLFECKCEEEDMLQGGLRAICGNGMNRSQTTKGAADTGADECDCVPSFRPLLSAQLAHNRGSVARIEETKQTFSTVPRMLRIRTQMGDLDFEEVGC